MELNATTFLLEVVNFLVLVWILKRFLYKPVRDIVARRQAAIEQTVGNAEAMKNEAEGLKHRYQIRLEEWEQEKRAARQQFKSELEAERSRALAAVEQAIAAERQRAEALDLKRKADRERQYQRAALEQGARFAAGLLTEAAGPELEERLLRLALDRLANLSQTTVDGIRQACETCPEEASVSTAYPLPQATRTELQNRLSELLGMSVACRFREDPQLGAGLCVTLGPWLFHANLRDELRGFVEAAADAG